MTLRYSIPNILFGLSHACALQMPRLNGPQALLLITHDSHHFLSRTLLTVLLRLFQLLQQTRLESPILSSLVAQ